MIEKYELNLDFPSSFRDPNDWPDVYKSFHEDFGSYEFSSGTFSKFGKDKKRFVV